MRVLTKLCNFTCISLVKVHLKVRPPATVTQSACHLGSVREAGDATTRYKRAHPSQYGRVNHKHLQTYTRQKLCPQFHRCSWSCCTWLVHAHAKLPDQESLLFRAQQGLSDLTRDTLSNIMPTVRLVTRFSLNPMSESSLGHPGQGTKQRCMGYSQPRGAGTSHLTPMKPMTRTRVPVPQRAATVIGNLRAIHTLTATMQGFQDGTPTNCLQAHHKCNNTSG